MWKCLSKPFLNAVLHVLPAALAISVGPTSCVCTIEQYVTIDFRHVFCRFSKKKKKGGRKVLHTLTADVLHFSTVDHGTVHFPYCSQYHRTFYCKYCSTFTL